MRPCRPTVLLFDAIFCIIMYIFFNKYANCFFCNSIFLLDLLFQLTTLFYSLDFNWILIVYYTIFQVVPQIFNLW